MADQIPTQTIIGKSGLDCLTPGCHTRLTEQIPVNIMTKDIFPVELDNRIRKLEQQMQNIREEIMLLKHQFKQQVQDGLNVWHITMAKQIHVSQHWHEKHLEDMVYRENQHSVHTGNLSLSETYFSVNSEIDQIGNSYVGSQTEESAEGKYSLGETAIQT